MKLLLVVLAGSAIGGFVGGSRLLCPDGSCAITGSWYGGAIIGGCLAYGIAGTWLAASTKTGMRPPE